ncbi:MAG: DUF2203 domain-containing protein [Chloroflexi bacterium]|nr:DUF2203 domain-containing protein [Chloroflexota bacterium]
MPRYFTPEEAAALIPQLSSILLEMQKDKSDLDAKEEELKEAQQRSKSNGHSQARELQAQRAALERLADKLNEGIARIGALGCQLKDIALGLVDFPAVREGKAVLLCWRLGEAAVDHWHEVDTGYGSRQPW